MTTVSTAFDFRKPPPGMLEQQAAGWLKLTSRRAAPVWAKVIPYTVELKTGPVEAVVASTGFKALTSDTLGFALTTGDEADGVVVLGMRRPLLLALVAGVLGDTPQSLPEDREPTVLESSLIGFLMRELILDPLEKGWPLSEPPSFSIGAPMAPRLIWKGLPEDLALLATWLVATPFGEYPMQLIVPRIGRWERLGKPESRPTFQVPGDSRMMIEALVQEMPVDMDVVLGTADMTMQELAELKEGDTVVLRRKTTEPLDGLVSGARKFRVWPGVIGARAAVLIESQSED